jgi:hypothetical protein
MTDLAKDVAKQLERRQRRRKLIVYSVWLLAVVLVALYVRCGRGWGIGGGGEGGGGGGSAAKSPHRCALRVTATGITLDGAPTTQGAVIAACRSGADVIVTGDAREGDWDQLRDALRGANIDVTVHDNARR